MKPTNGQEKRKPTIDVCFSPALFNMYDAENSITVVIDILRATSSICVAFEHGVKSIIPVSTIEEAIEYKSKGFLIGAERHGEMLPGFDFGNSPFSYMEPRIKDRDIVLTTTNGTRAFEIAKDSFKVVAGSFLNMDVLIHWLREQQHNVILLCAGWKNTFNLEDTLFAGAMVYKLKKDFDFSIGRDSCIAAEYLYMLGKNDMYKFLEESSHRLRLEKLHIEKDIAYCLTPNQTQVIPCLNGHALYNMHVMEAT
ncbi:MAG TPA: 2-phosphosulfolactate phosphatase [Bacteroidia bacterium]|nr:2-phosphosulfolactate phosphatase [Bacteroidia bacterium]